MFENSRVSYLIINSKHEQQEHDDKFIFFTHQHSKKCHSNKTTHVRCVGLCRCNPTPDTEYQRNASLDTLVCELIAINYS